MRTLTIIGAGQVGKTLGYLLTHKTDLKLNYIINSSLESGQEACHFIEGGKPVIKFEDLRPSDVYMITVPDQKIFQMCEALSATDLLVSGNIVFHCSGFLNSEALIAAQSKGAYVASLHPPKSFTDPQSSIKTFAGTLCALEGDFIACDLINTWIEAMGGQTFPVLPHQKIMYHAACVISSNYLVTLAEVAKRTFENAGVSEENSMHILKSFMSKGVEQIFSNGTMDALTGPISRGECEVISEELKALSAWGPTVTEIYKWMGQIGVELSEKKKKLDPKVIERMKEILST